MPDFVSSINEHQDLPEDAQKQAGKAIAGNMGDAHTDFVKTISRMITKQEIDVTQTETFFNKAVYDALDEESKAKVDVATVNVADLLRHIAAFYVSKETPDAAPQLQTMIEQLWQMKERVESQYGDVFIF